MAQEGWDEQLHRTEYRSLLRRKQYGGIAARAVRLESGTNLLFSFDKMAIRDAVRSPEGARQFAEGLYDFIYGPGGLAKKCERWGAVVSGLPRKQTRVLTWPVVTVFGFSALPGEHIFLKPNVTRKTALEYGYEFEYRSRPEWITYANYLDFARVRRDLRDLRPRDMIDIQSFLWIQGIRGITSRGASISRNRFSLVESNAKELHHGNQRQVCPSELQLPR